MKNVTHSFVFLAHWPSAGSFGLNTEILATNLVNLTVVVGVLIFFGKGVYLLDNRKQRILSTIRNSEELRRGTIEQLKKARIRLQKVELEADEYRMNGYSKIEREKANLINATSISLAMNQVRQRVFQQAVQGALGTLNSCLNTELHFRTIRANIDILGSLEWKR
ncbi:unnamed protein product [Triticum turgidum subsp. durum]|uniref:ATP synthase subunit b, chloroplastic n=1 Tax=Triticum turgidum subsp. durum TaxID=4567 RepID=A0A9R0VDZ3_TRITD|nr:unnamed protein product [Triticum turgidum subsp. durum]